MLENYNYPGNVRELENIIERALVIAATDEITVDCLRPEVRDPKAALEMMRESEGASSEIDIAGGSDDEGAAEEDGAASEDDGAAEDDGAGASLELTTAELDDGSTGVTGVGVPRLKIQMRPTITITATMMIIQVLRFIGCLPLCWRRQDREVLSFCLDALPPPVCAASNFSSVIGGVEFRRSLCFFFVRGVAA